MPMTASTDGDDQGAPERESDSSSTPSDPRPRPGEEEPGEPAELDPVRRGVERAARLYFGLCRQVARALNRSRR
jgi:hypothetical protein